LRYDEVGGEPFERITALAEYYPSRAEAQHALHHVGRSDLGASRPRLDVAPMTSLISSLLQLDPEDTHLASTHRRHPVSVERAVEVVGASASLRIGREGECSGGIPWLAVMLAWTPYATRNTGVTHEHHGASAP